MATVEENWHTSGDSDIAICGPIGGTEGQQGGREEPEKKKRQQNRLYNNTIVVQLFQEWIRQDHAGVYQAFQDNALVAVPEIPHLHGPDESTLEIVVRFELLSLQQLMSRVNFKALDDRRPQSHGLLPEGHATVAACRVRPHFATSSSALNWISRYRRLIRVG